MVDTQPEVVPRRSGRSRNSASSTGKPPLRDAGGRRVPQSEIYQRIEGEARQAVLDEAAFDEEAALAASEGRTATTQTPKTPATLNGTPSLRGPTRNPAPEPLAPGATSKSGTLSGLPLTWNANPPVALGTASFDIGNATPAKSSTRADAPNAPAPSAHSLDEDPQFATPRTGDVLNDNADIVNVCRTVFDDTRVRNDLEAIREDLAITHGKYAIEIDALRRDYDGRLNDALAQIRRYDTRLRTAQEAISTLATRDQHARSQIAALALRIEAMKTRPAPTADDH